MSAPRRFTTLGGILADWCADDPGATALITEHRTFTVAALADLVDAQARAVAACTPPGARVGVHTSNSAEALALLYAVPVSGRTLVPLNFRLADRELADQLRRADVALLLGDQVDGFPGPTISLAELTDGARSSAEGRRVDDPDSPLGRVDIDGWSSPGRTDRPRSSAEGRRVGNPDSPHGRVDIDGWSSPGRADRARSSTEGLRADDPNSPHDRVGVDGWSSPERTATQRPPAVDSGHSDTAESSAGPSSAAPSSSARAARRRSSADDPNGVDGPDPDAVAWIIFTSGSTGPPKGVLLTHASLAAAVATTAAARPLADDEVYLYPFPLFHVAAYNVLHAHARRRPVVLPDRFDACRIIELCHRHDVTAMSLAATMLRMLLDALADDPGLSPPATLRTIAYGAAPMPEGLLREAHDVFGCDFAQGYGSTELSGNAIFLSPADHRRGLGGERRLLHAAGYAGPGVAVRVVDETAHDVPPGRAGELLVAGSQVCAGYLDDPEATAGVIDGGWLHTGDVATVDDDGLVHIVDRAKDIVVTGGENVASRQVEDALRSHPFVADVAVIGTPDPHWGEAVTAVIVLATAGPHSPVGVGVGDGHGHGDGHGDGDGDGDGDGVGEAGVAEAPDAVADELRRHVGDQLAGFARPRRVFITDALPHNANGKVDKPALRAAVAGLPDL